MISISIYRRGDHLNGDIFGYSLLHKAAVTGGDIPPLLGAQAPAFSAQSSSTLQWITTPDTRHQVTRTSVTGLSVLTDTTDTLHLDTVDSRQQRTKKIIWLIVIN